MADDYTKVLTKDADKGGSLNHQGWESRRTSFIKSVVGVPCQGILHSESNLRALRSYIDEVIHKVLAGKPIAGRPKGGQTKPEANVSMMSGVEFENYCAEQLRQHGWKITLTKESGDQGVDLLAKKKQRVVAIQCKRFTAKVGNGAVQEISSGRLHYSADAAVVVTNSSFTKQAIDLARTTGVKLMHYSDLPNLESMLD
ncbi:MAG: restriction endonuclease [Rhizobium sp.]|nr:MAG: restriction endonuclease [Rhizobium sp.]